MRDTPRVRRLRNDLRVMRKLCDESTIISFKVTPGDAPEAYIVTFQGKGISRPRGKCSIANSHTVDIKLPAEYPRVMPMLLWKSEIFHPNVSARGGVCLGGYQTNWVPSLDLAELCDMLWDMIRFANFDVRSPYNREAAGWVTLQKEFAFPLDHRPLRDKLSANRVETPAATLSELPQQHKASRSASANNVAHRDDEIVMAELVEQAPPTTPELPETPDILFID